MLGNKKQEYEMKNEELFKKIHEILIRDWDPIGVSDQPNAHDEYDVYIPGIIKIILKNKSIDQVVNHLASIEKVIGVYNYPRPEILKSVAVKLKGLRVNETS